jgi:hypothetical protein
MLRNSSLLSKGRPGDVSLGERDNSSKRERQDNSLEDNNILGRGRREERREERQEDRDCRRAYLCQQNGFTTRDLSGGMMSRTIQQ